MNTALLLGGRGAYSGEDNFLTLKKGHYLLLVVVFY